MLAATLGLTQQPPWLNHPCVLVTLEPTCPSKWGGSLVDNTCSDLNPTSGSCDSSWKGRLGPRCGWRA